DCEEEELGERQSPRLRVRAREGMRLALDDGRGGQVAIAEVDAVARRERLRGRDRPRLRRRGRGHRGARQQEEGEETRWEAVPRVACHPNSLGGPDASASGIAGSAGYASGGQCRGARCVRGSEMPEERDQSAGSTVADAPRTDFDVVVVGAGFAGIY